MTDLTNFLNLQINIIYELIKCLEKNLEIKKDEHDYVSEISEKLFTKIDETEKLNKKLKQYDNLLKIKGSIMDLKQHIQIKLGVIDEFKKYIANEMDINE